MNNPLEPLKKMYSNLNYYQFCEYLELDPDYSEKYWKAFHSLLDCLAVFDNERIRKIFEFGKVKGEDNVPTNPSL